MCRNRCQKPVTAAFSRKRAFHTPFPGGKERPVLCPETARTAGRSEKNAAQRAAFFLLLFLVYRSFLPKRGVPCLFGCWRVLPLPLEQGWHTGRTRGGHGASAPDKHGGLPIAIGSPPRILSGQLTASSGSSFSSGVFSIQSRRHCVSKSYISKSYSACRSPRRYRFRDISKRSVIMSRVSNPDQFAQKFSSLNTRS